MKLAEAQTASSGQQAASDHANLVLAEDAIAGLEDLGAGLVGEGDDLDDALGRKPHDKSTGEPAPGLPCAISAQPKRAGRWAGVLRTAAQVLRTSFMCCIDEVDMAVDDLMEFECMACGIRFNRTWFEVSRSYERVHFNSPAALDEVETSHSENISASCSRTCHETTRLAVMQEQNVPVPLVRPDIGPVETCAKCSGQVDMSDWHLTFAEGRMAEQGSTITALEFDYVAVVCKKCMPYPRAGGGVVGEVSSEVALPIGAAAKP